MPQDMRDLGTDKASLDAVKHLATDDLVEVLNHSTQFAAFIAHVAPSNTPRVARRRKVTAWCSSPLGYDRRATQQERANSMQSDGFGNCSEAH